MEHHREAFGRGCVPSIRQVSRIEEVRGDARQTGMASCVRHRGSMFASHTCVVDGIGTAVSRAPTLPTRELRGRFHAGGTVNLFLDAAFALLSPLTRSRVVDTPLFAPSGWCWQQVRSPTVVGSMHQQSTPGCFNARVSSMCPSAR